MNLLGYHGYVQTTPLAKEVHAVKSSRKEVRRKAHAIPKLKFECQSLTSFAGLVIVQRLVALLDLKGRLARCFAHQKMGKIFTRSILFLQLVLHLLLGYRELRESRCYQDDPLVKRLLGLNRLPDVATLSRMLRQADAKSVVHLRALLKELIFDRLIQLGLARITLDFDGSVQSTTRKAEGTAVGYNKKKGARSYYPLFCTVAQTGQVLDFLARSGNVHDSHGAKEFILACIEAVREVLPGVVIEVRMDSAFFSDEIVTALSTAGIEFTLSRSLRAVCPVEASHRGVWVLVGVGSGGVGVPGVVETGVVGSGVPVCVRTHAGEASTERPGATGPFRPLRTRVRVQGGPDQQGVVDGTGDRVP
jgi:hypothetical protein